MRKHKGLRMLFLPLMMCWLMLLTVQAEEPPADVIVMDTHAYQDEAVEGDLVLMGQILSAKADVQGDVLATGTEFSLDGAVSGSVRAMAGNVSIKGSIGRNVTVLAGHFQMDPQTRISGHLYLMAENAVLSGRVAGKTVLAVSSVTLAGQFDGDVVIKTPKSGKRGDVRIAWEPGTVIAGTLHYQGAQPPEIPDDVQVHDISFTPVEADPSGLAAWVQPRILYRRILSMLLLYLLSLALFRLFPEFFEWPAEAIAQRPISVAGTGVAAFGVSVASMLLLILFGFLSFFLFKPLVPITAFLLLIVVLLLLSGFAIVPVGLWLGRTLLRGRGGIPGTLACGLAVLTTISLLLELLSVVPGLGTGMTVLRWLFAFAVWLMGTGAILGMLRTYYRSASRGKMLQEELIAPD